MRPIARHHRMPFNDERIVGMGRQAVLHAVPLAQRYDDQPGDRLLIRNRGQAFGQGARVFPCIRKATYVGRVWTASSAGLPMSVSFTVASPWGRVGTSACTSSQVGAWGGAWGGADVGVGCCRGLWV